MWDTPINNCMNISTPYAMCNNMAAMNNSGSILDNVAYNRFSQQAPNSIQTLTGYQKQLQDVLNSSTSVLTAEQKSRIQAKIDEIKTLIQQVTAFVNNRAASAQQVYEFETRIIQAQMSVRELAKAINAEVQQAAQSAQNSNSQTQPAQQPGQPGQSGQAEQSGVMDEQLQREMEDLENKAVDICQDVYQGAIGCGANWNDFWNNPGTDYARIKQGTNRINKDNVAVVLAMWNKQYVETELVGDKNGMIETLFAEEMICNPKIHPDELGADKKFADPKNNMQIIWNIVKCLEEKARELNIYNQLAGQFTVAYDELDDTFVDQTAVEKAVNDIYQKVLEVQQQDMLNKAAQRQQQTTQTEENNNNNQTTNDNQLAARRLFQNELRNALKDENAKISDRVRYENGQFVIRVDGRNYTGSSYSELAKALKDAGYEPKEYLTKQQFRAAA